jgi:hypothetical protein
VTILDSAQIAITSSSRPELTVPGAPEVLRRLAALRLERSAMALVEELFPPPEPAQDKEQESS